MARILGGIGASHAPSMEHVYDAGAEVRRSDEWEPLFGPFQQVSEWLEELRPDRLLVIYNDSGGTSRGRSSRTSSTPRSARSSRWTTA